MEQTASSLECLQGELGSRQVDTAQRQRSAKELLEGMRHIFTSPVGFQRIPALWLCLLELSGVLALIL